MVLNIKALVWQHAGAFLLGLDFVRSSADPSLRSLVRATISLPHSLITTPSTMAVVAQSRCSADQGAQRRVRG
jgi:hypothetical protein